MAIAASLKIGSMVGTDSSKGIPVSWFSHEIASDIDVTVHKYLDRRVHKPFVIRKQIDLTSPFFHEYLMKGVEMPSWELRLIHPENMTGDTHYFSIVLEKAQVQEISSVMPDLTNAKLAYVHEYEDISFTYETIRWKARAMDVADKASNGFAPDWLNEKTRATALQAAAAAAVALLKKAAPKKDKDKEK